MKVRSAPSQGIYLLDLAALVVGYSLASFLVRAFWPVIDEPSLTLVVVFSLAFLWLGLAMSGPILLVGSRRPATAEANEAGISEPRTWAELAWLIIGFYWIVLTILVVPVRMRQTRVLDSAFLGIFPVLAAIGLRVLRPPYLAKAKGRRTWTHDAAIGLLVTWPFAWVALIILGKSLP